MWKLNVRDRGEGDHTTMKITVTGEVVHLTIKGKTFTLYLVRKEHCLLN
jgi:hypothetical protein